MWNALLPPILVVLAAAGVIGYLLLAPPPITTAERAVVLSAGGLVALIAILWSVSQASSAAGEATGDVTEIRALVPRGGDELHNAVERWRRGERPAPANPPGPDAGELEFLAYEVERFRNEAVDAVVRAGSTVTAAGPTGSSVDVRVGVFVNLARRLQSLVHREIQLLDDLEAQVEEPDLLKGLFAVDHLATRIRRHAENLAVLGGAVTSRQWSKPVNMYVVLRSAVAEVEQYSRVKLVRPIDGTLKGHAVADVIHLVAELVENATSFSNPSTQVLLRAQRVTAGVALEVEDRGLGMPREDQNRLNSMLSSPDQVDVAELLSDGRIGLFVVSTLARRHGVAVQLQTNIYGGTQAVIVLPHEMLGEDPAPAEPAKLPGEPPQLEQRPAPASDAMPLRPEPNGANPTAQPAVSPVSASPVSATPVSAGPSPYPSGNPAAVPVSAAPASPAAGGPALMPGLAAETPPPAPRRPLPYAGRGAAPGGAASVSPDPRQPAERQPSPLLSGGQQPGPAAPAPATQNPPPRGPGFDRPSPGTGAGLGEMSQSLFSTDNPNETTGVIHVGPIPPGEGPTLDSASGGPAEPVRPSPGAESSDARPQLPQRRRQTHLVPELREAAAPRVEQIPEHDPGLMMAFQEGVNRAEPGTEDAEGRVDGSS